MAVIICIANIAKYALFYLEFTSQTGASVFLTACLRMCVMFLLMIVCTEDTQWPDPHRKKKPMISTLLELTVRMHCVWTTIKFVSAQALTLPALPAL